jgi:hypothetical protein
MANFNPNCKYPNHWDQGPSKKPKPTQAPHMPAATASVAHTSHRYLAGTMVHFTHQLATRQWCT